MINFVNNKNLTENLKKNYRIDTNNTITDITRSDIETTYNIDTSNGTEAYYSNRYGWSLRKAIL